MNGAATCVLSCVLIGCGGAADSESRRTSPEVETQIAAARGATIPSGIRLTESSGPARQGSMVSAGWSFDLRTDWEAYASQASASLQGAGYETVNRGPGVLAFAQRVPGDVYRVRIAEKALASGTRVTVRFSASPD